jgi:hypothetical protein
MVNPEQINADMLAFWNGQGGHTWVARQAHMQLRCGLVRRSPDQNT